MIKQIFPSSAQSTPALEVVLQVSVKNLEKYLSMLLDFSGKVLLKWGMP